MIQRSNSGFRELEKEDKNKNKGMNCWSEIQPQMDFCYTQIWN
jgi:hypothetical protein